MVYPKVNHILLYTQFLKTYIQSFRAYQRDFQIDRSTYLNSPVLYTLTSETRRNYIWNCMQNAIQVQCPFNWFRVKRNDHFVSQATCDWNISRALFLSEYERAAIGQSHIITTHHHHHTAYPHSVLYFLYQLRMLHTYVSIPLRHPWVWNWWENFPKVSRNRKSTHLDHEIVEIHNKIIFPHFGWRTTPPSTLHPSI